MITVRPIETRDRDAWSLLWDGYNEFYHRRTGPTAVGLDVTESTWSLFFAEAEPVWAMVAELDGQVVGFVHIVYHRSTSFVQPVCYLQDLFTASEARGHGAGGALIQAVYERASRNGVSRVYWNTQDSNAVARRLYDRVATKTDFLLYRRDGL